MKTQQHHGGDAISDREALVGRMVEEIASDGYFVANLPPQPFQDIIDLRWAAQQAGRVLGRRVRAYTSSVGARQPEMITMVAASVEARSIAEVSLCNRAQAVVEDLLDASASAYRRAIA